MTTLSLEHIRTNTPYTVSQKPWFKEYAFRIAFHGWDLFNIDSSTVHIHKQVRDTLRNSNIGFKQRQDRNYYIYLKSSEDVSLLLEQFENHIIHISGPYSEKHKNTMLSDLSIVVKDNLFYKEYRYKLSFWLTRQDMDFFEEISEFVIDNIEYGTYRFNSVIRNYPSLKERDKMQISPNRWHSLGATIIPFYATGTVYLKSYDDLVTIHMLYKSKITSSVKIVLTTEIE